MDGIINLIKPQNMTSHDVVNIVRKKLMTKRVGHTGTLDPMATGVLPICVGQATRVIEYLVADKKKYKCQLTLGIKTDTQDIWGEVLEKKDVHITEEEIKNTVKTFIGDITQIPPMYSAVRIDGRRLYEYAREGVEIQRESRKVTIYHIDIISIQGEKITLEVECSKGTYIRTLCNDIGEALGCYGTMSALERIASGIFTIDEGITLEDLGTLSPEEYLIPADQPLTEMGQAEIKDKKTFLKASNGGSLSDAEVLWKDKKKWNRIYYKHLFIAIGEYNGENSKIRMKKVFNYTELPI
ncbi:MAG: tRNA pseudouridine(55) synthase TruB [Peptostreptococcales bacterium]